MCVANYMPLLACRYLCVATCMSLLMCFTCVSLLNHLNIYLQWISVYGIYEFIYISVHLQLSNQEIKAKKILACPMLTALPSA
jgi:hypothetical protein